MRTNLVRSRSSYEPVVDASWIRGLSGVNAGVFDVMFLRFCNTDGRMMERVE